MKLQGSLNKMRVKLGEPVDYALPVGDEELPLNSLIGQTLSITYQGEIHCIYCGRKTNKSFNQGYCFPCFRDLARCDLCIVKPELCHFDQGTCREPEWAMGHCMQDHYVYLANSSGVKVGITRHTQIPTRWIDQGAIQALPILKVKSRHQAGLVEVAMKEHVNDRTSWQKMLRGGNSLVDLAEKREELFSLTTTQIDTITERFGDGSLECLRADETVRIDYPVLEYPQKVKSLNLDKDPEVTATLMGIKGQYLIFDTGVINIRKFGGYCVEVKAG